MTDRKTIIRKEEKRFCRTCGAKMKLFRDSVLLRTDGSLQKGDIYVCQKCGRGILITENKKTVCF